MEAYILLVLFWTSDRVAMTSAEFNSKATCEAARVAMSKEMDTGLIMVGRKTYSVCAKK
jgi:hypothetical protein